MSSCIDQFMLANPSGDADNVAVACCGLCCICCGEGLISWLQLTRCCPGSDSRQAGCCGPCLKRSFDSKDDWVEQERERRRQESHTQEGVDPSVVSTQPAPRASMDRRSEIGVESEHGEGAGNTKME